MLSSGFALIFGLMRIANLTHGSLFMLGAYVAATMIRGGHGLILAACASMFSMTVVGGLIERLILRRLTNNAQGQVLATLGLSFVVADLCLMIWGGDPLPIQTPPMFIAPMEFFGLRFPTYRLFVLGFSIVVGILLYLLMERTRLGAMIRAGVDDRGMLSASGVNVQRIFAMTFALGAGLAGLAGVVGGTALSISPGEDTRYLLASLVVVIVGGMGSVPGAAIGALLIGLAEQFGQAYAPTYSVVFTFVIMILALAFRPRGVLGKAS